MSAAGHNSLNPAALRDFIDKIENLETEAADIRIDIRELYIAAKGAGFDPKAMKAVVKERLMTLDQKKRRAAAEQAKAEILAALGDYADMPLGQAAMSRAAQ